MKTKFRFEPLIELKDDNCFSTNFHSFKGYKNRHESKPLVITKVLSLIYPAIFYI